MCRASFGVTPDLIGADVQCPQCSCQFNIRAPQPKVSQSGISLEDISEDDMAPMSTVRLTRSKKVLEQLRGNMPKPAVKQAKQKLAEVEPINMRVACPSCASAFEIAEEFFGAVGECPDCNTAFIIKKPQPIEPEPQASNQPYSSIRIRSTRGPDASPGSALSAPSSGSSAPSGPGGTSPGINASGIEITKDELAPKRYSATATVRLTRDMSSRAKERKKQEMAPPPPPERVAQMQEVLPVNDEVACIGCKGAFEVTPDFYGAVAECPDCGAEFIIGTPEKKAKAPLKVKSAPPPPAPPSPPAPAPVSQRPPTPAPQPKAAPAPKKPAVARKKQTPQPQAAQPQAPTKPKATAKSDTKERKMSPLLIMILVIIGIIVLGVVILAFWVVFGNKNDETATALWHGIHPLLATVPTW